MRFLAVLSLAIFALSVQAADLHEMLCGTWSIAPIERRGEKVEFKSIHKFTATEWVTDDVTTTTREYQVQQANDDTRRLLIKVREPSFVNQYTLTFAADGKSAKLVFISKMNRATGDRVNHDPKSGKPLDLEYTLLKKSDDSDAAAVARSMIPARLAAKK